MLLDPCYSSCGPGTSTISSLGFVLQMPNLCPQTTRVKNLHFDKTFRLFQYSPKFGKQIRDLIFVPYLLHICTSLPRSMLLQLNKHGKGFVTSPGSHMQLVADPDVGPRRGPDLDSRSWGLRLSCYFQVGVLGLQEDGNGYWEPFLAFLKAQLLSPTSS